MARLRQGITYKYANNKNKKPKYKAVSSKYSYSKKDKEGTTKKYSYTKKIYKNGKARYYYA